MGGLRITTTGAAMTAALCALLAIAAPPALGAAGGLDPAFGGDGKVVLDAAGSDEGEAVAVLPDGKTLVAAGVNGGVGIFVSRLNPDGTPDTSFDVDGTAIVDRGADPRALAVQPDGKILVAGRTTTGAVGGSDAAVFRLKPDGGTQNTVNDALDPSFDVDGVAQIDSGQFEEANALAVQPADGKIVIAGQSCTCGTGNAAVYRLKANGGTTNAVNDALDPTFDTDGAAGIDSGGTEQANAIALEPDGKILIAGYTTNATGGSDAVVWRLKANGGSGALNNALDLTFNVDGAAGMDSGGYDQANALALRPDGKIVVAGFTGGSSSGPHDAAVWRLAADGGTQNVVNGALDTSFDVDGAATVDSGGTEAANAVALQPDGKILVAGYTATNTSSARNAAVWRLKADGGTQNIVNTALDNTFDGDGTATVDNGDSETANALALMPDRRIVAAGITAPVIPLNSDTFVFRLFGDPYNLTVAKSGAGSVTSGPTGISCGATCSAGFDLGTSVTLTAHPAAGSKFAGWSGGGCSGTGTCQVTMSADQSVTATFALTPVPPNTKISKAKINQAKNSAKFKFKAVGGNKAKAPFGFQCALLKKRHAKPKFKPCSSPKRYKHLKPRKYTFEVRAFDPAGKDPTPAKRKFRIKP